MSATNVKLSLGKVGLRKSGLMLLVICTFFFFAFIQSSRGLSADGYDPYYHMAMSRIVSEKGVDYHENWLEGTIFESFYANLLIGFHVFSSALITLVPNFDIFTLSRFLIIGISSSVLLSVYVLSRSNPLTRALIMLLLVVTPTAFYRLNIFRPHLLGFFFFLLVLYSITRGRHLLLVMALVVHLLSHASALFSIALVAIQLFMSWDSRVLDALLAAAALFLFLHPAGVGTLLLHYRLQVLNVPFDDLDKGADWQPSTSAYFVRELGPFLFLVFLVLILLLKKGIALDSESTLKMAAVPMFFLAASKHARFRVNLAIALAVLFGDIFSAVEKRVRFGFKTLALILIVGSFWFSSYSYLYSNYRDFQGVDFEEEALRLNTSLWLDENTGPSRILNDWDAFPVLFYGNDYGYVYSSGVDPAFLYQSDPIRYKRHWDALHGYMSFDERHSLVRGVFDADYIVLSAPDVELEENTFFDLLLTGGHVVLGVA